jgi:hypothetical protein
VIAYENKMLEAELVHLPIFTRDEVSFRFGRLEILPELLG